MQCYAPDDDAGKRCQNDAINENTTHCAIHHPLHLKLYKRYKTVCKLTNQYDVTKADTMDDLRDKIKYVNRCYCIYIKEYELRKEHQLKCLVPEVIDYGHDRRVRETLEKAQYCEACLYELHQQFIVQVKPKTHQKEEEEEVDDQLKEEIVQCYEKTVDFQKQRRQDDIETERLMKIYIKDTNTVMKRRAAIKRQILEALPPVKEDQFDLIMIVCASLDGMGYFAESYKPLMCDCEFKCGQYRRVHVACNRKQDFSESNLLWLLDQIVENINKVSPILEDMQISKKRDSFFCLSWAPDLRRIVFRFENYFTIKQRMLSDHKQFGVQFGFTYSTKMLARSIVTVKRVHKK
jgi:hypothetical protein